ncbi:hypothetical protein OROHE_001022 [Orobanche hederae]
MGGNEGWAKPGGPFPNGLMPGAGPIMRSLDADRWVKAEERIAELIACIQPNQLSEERRNAVADYVQRLIMKCFPCQVCTFGSVPLKTYLPDGDIDLTAFSNNQNLKDTWANQVRDMLQNEEKKENAEFHVKEVQYIQAEVKIVKCLVENIVVDISFNQVGGLCTLCFLNEVDYLINQDHLFKRSVILIKAWCYYESRILGAHHGLISTYALETLVLYIFHVFNKSFHGPLEVLYRFLEFFSNFDWDNVCVSLWGPVPISSLPDVTAEPPRKDSGELLLSKVFLDACSSVYAVFPGGQTNNGQPFVSKHFNVIDPLRVNNNLGRSVSKGNFFRIRSAFAFGAKRLARLLDCPKENLIFEVNQFFMNTWDRHGSGHRPDAPGIDSRRLRLSTPDTSHEFGTLNNNNSSSKKVKEDSRAHGKKSSKMVPIASELSEASHRHGLKGQINRNNPRVTEQTLRDIGPCRALPNGKIHNDLKSDHSANDTHGRLLFARTRSSPELTDNYINMSSQVQYNRQTENADTSYSRPGSSNWRNPISESLPSHCTDSSAEDAFTRHQPIQKSPDTADSSSVSNGYNRESGLDGLSDEFSARMMNQEEQDIVNMMASASLQPYNSQVHAPFNLSSGHLPYSIPPSFLASTGYSQRNLPGFFPANIPFTDPSFSHVQFPQGFVSPQLTHYFPGTGPNNPSQDSVELGNENYYAVEMSSADVDNDFWTEQDAGSSCGYDIENGNLDTFQSVDKSSAGLKYIPPPSRISGLSSAARVQRKHSREKRGSVRGNIESLANWDDNRSSEVYAEEKSASSRLSTVSHSNSLRSRTSSESSWDGSSVRASKSLKEKRSRKIISTDLTTSHRTDKIMSEHVPNDADDDDQEWGPSRHMGTDMVHRQHIPGIGVAQTSGSDSMIPFAPMLINPGSRQRTNDSSGLIAFYPTGPPVPFLTMLPVYNIPHETEVTGASVAPNGHFGNNGSHEILDNSESQMSFNPEGHDLSSNLSSSGFVRGMSVAEQSEERKSDILNSDFASHLQNLQFGRFCQNSRPLLYPSPVMVPPVYVQGRLPYETPSRPLSTNTNLFSQLTTSYGHRVVPVGPLQPVSSRLPNIYQSYMDDMPRHRSGTGTYLPNLKVSVRDRHSSGNKRGSYNHDRNDSLVGDREGNWNANSNLRAATHNHIRTQSDNKINSRTRFTHSEIRADRSWNSNRNNSIRSYQSQDDPLCSNSSQNSPQNAAYNVYPLGAMNPSGAGVSNESPVALLYPFDHTNTTTYSSHRERLEFGSLGPAEFSGISERSQLSDRTRARGLEDHHRLHGSSGYRSSSEQPSSPRHQSEGLIIIPAEEVPNPRAKSRRMIKKHSDT